MRRLAPLALVTAALLAGWQLLVMLTGLPPYLLPAPLGVAQSLVASHASLAAAARITGTEIVLGFVLGASVGAALALALAQMPRLLPLVEPLFLLSQTIPIFALAPILSLWLGFGMAPKVAVVALMTFLPVTANFLTGLRQSDPALDDLARVSGATAARHMVLLRLPAALPMLGAGLRLGAIYAPVGAVVGEWVGGSIGLGAMMIHANGRMRTDLMFAALVWVVGLTSLFHGIVSWATKRAFARYG